MTSGNLIMTSDVDPPQVTTPLEWLKLDPGSTKHANLRVLGPNNHSSLCCGVWTSITTPT